MHCLIVPARTTRPSSHSISRCCNLLSALHQCCDMQSCRMTLCILQLGKHLAIKNSILVVYKFVFKDYREEYSRLFGLRFRLSIHLEPLSMSHLLRALYRALFFSVIPSSINLLRSIHFSANTSSMVLHRFGSRKKSVIFIALE